MTPWLELREGKISNDLTKDQFDEMLIIFDFAISNEMDPRRHS